MLGTSIRIKGLAVAVVAATTLLGGCISMPPPGPGGGGGGGGVTPAPTPAPTPPHLQQAPACEQRVGRNGGHGFWDIGRGECWSCPMGSVRTVFPVNQDWACNLGGILNPSYARAEYLGT